MGAERGGQYYARLLLNNPWQPRVTGAPELPVPRARAAKHDVIVRVEAWGGWQYAGRGENGITIPLLNRNPTQPGDHRPLLNVVAELPQYSQSVVAPWATQYPNEGGESVWS